MLTLAVQSFMMRWSISFHFIVMGLRGVEAFYTSSTSITFRPELHPTVIARLLFQPKMQIPSVLEIAIIKPDVFRKATLGPTDFDLLFSAECQEPLPAYFPFNLGPCYAFVSHIEPRPKPVKKTTSTQRKTPTPLERRRFSVHLT